MDSTILIIEYGIIALVLAVGGVFAINKGYILFKTGVGLMKDETGYSLEQEGFKNT